MSLTLKDIRARIEYALERVETENRSLRLQMIREVHLAYLEGKRETQAETDFWRVKAETLQEVIADYIQALKEGHTE